MGTDAGMEAGVGLKSHGKRNFISKPEEKTSQFAGLSSRNSKEEQEPAERNSGSEKDEPSDVFFNPSSRKSKEESRVSTRP